MASTIQLSRTMSNSQQFIRNAPIDITTSHDPAFMIADWVRMTILAPPLAWRWNRNSTTITLAAGTQDYSKALADFGWLETATIVDNTANPPIIHELQIMNIVAEEGAQNQPTSVSARLDDDAGNITFRILPVPDKTYTLNLTYQKQALVFANTTDTWAPIPDYLSYLYNIGFLAKTYEYFGDSRFSFSLQMFLRQLIAASAGIDNTQRDIFMASMINSSRDQNAQMMKSQEGSQGRGGF